MGVAVLVADRSLTLEKSFERFRHTGKLRLRQTRLLELLCEGAEIRAFEADSLQRRLDGRVSGR